METTCDESILRRYPITKYRGRGQGRLRYVYTVQWLDYTCILTAYVV